MSLSKTKSWYSKNCLHFKAYCSIGPSSEISSRVLLLINNFTKQLTCLRIIIYFSPNKDTETNDQSMRHATQYYDIQHNHI
jgi:hypothetical protein